MKKLALFFHIIDNTGSLDLVDLSFICMIIKIVIAPNIDFPSVCGLVPVLLAKMHRFHIESKNDNNS